MKARPLFTSDAVPTEDQMERYYAATITLQKKTLDYACMLFQLVIIWTRKVKTGGTDSVYLYINPDFFFSLSTDGQRAFLLAHEVGHVVLRHIQRAAYFNARGYHSIIDDVQIPWIPMQWNIDCDKVINNDLIAMKLEPIPCGIYDPSVSRDDVVDDVYIREVQDMLNRPQPEGDESGNKSGDESEGQSGSAGQSNDSDDSDESGSNTGSESSDESGNESDEAGSNAGDESGEKDGQPGQGSSSSDSADDESDESGAKSGATGSNHGGFDDHFQPCYEGDDDQQSLDREADQMEIDQAIKDAVEQAEDMRRHMGGIGRGSGIFGRALAQVQERLSQVDWRTELAEYVTARCGGGESNWKQIHRRRYAMYGALTPTQMGLLDSMIYIEDRSGSAHHLHDLFMNEFANLIDTMHPVNGVKVLWVDDQVLDTAEVHSGAELLELEAPAGGGTRLDVAFERIDEEGWDASVIVCFTDGEMYESDMQTFADRGALLVLDRQPYHGDWISDLLEKTGVRYIVVQPD